MGSSVSFCFLNFFTFCFVKEIFSIRPEIYGLSHFLLDFFIEFSFSKYFLVQGKGFGMQAASGVLVWYYYTCHRQVWLMSREINPHQDDPLLEIGRFLQETSYPKERKSIRLENMQIDLIKRKGRDVVVGEVKKSSRYLQSARMQLIFYLDFLRDYGIYATGELLFPRERKVIPVEMSELDIGELRRAKEGIEEILRLEYPPKAEYISFCCPCAYRGFCWS